MLVLDGIDLWLAAGTGVGGVSAGGILDLISELREVSSSSPFYPEEKLS